MYVCGPQESNSSYQSWPQAPLTAEPFAPQQLFSFFVNHTLKIDSILYSQSFRDPSSGDGWYKESAMGEENELEQRMKMSQWNPLLCIPTPNIF